MISGHNICFRSFAEARIIILTPHGKHRSWVTPMYKEYYAPRARGRSR
jgi:hypothetical protein